MRSCSNNSLENKGLFLIEKKKNYWIVYDYNEFVSNYTAEKHRFLNNNYVSIEVTAFRSGMGTNIYSWYLIFDLKNKTYITLFKSEYNANDEGIIINKCESEIKFKNEKFMIKRTSFTKNKCEYCIESGIYKIINGKFVKV